MWGISGDVGDDFKQIVAEQIKQQLAVKKAQQEMELAAQQMELQRAQDERAQKYLELQTKQFEAAEARRLNDTEAREKANQQGARRMMQDFIIQRNGPLSADDRRGLAALQVESEGKFDPRLLEEEKPERDPIEDYKQRKIIDMQFERPAAQKPERDPIADYRARKQIDAEFAQQKQSQNAMDPKAAQDTRQEILSAAEALRNHGGRKSFTGTNFNPSHLFGWYDDPIEGTDAAGAKALYDNLVSLMALPNLEKLRGPLSDKDIEFIKSASSRLKPGAPDADFENELNAIIQKLQAAGGGAVNTTPNPAQSALQELQRRREDAMRRRK
jgi:hypothetical protein